MKDGKICTSPVVLDAKNVGITNPKTQPRPMNCYRNYLINCRDNEHHKLQNTPPQSRSYLYQVIHDTGQELINRMSFKLEHSK